MATTVSYTTPVYVIVANPTTAAYVYQSAVTSSFTLYLPWLAPGSVLLTCSASQLFQAAVGSNITPYGNIRDIFLQTNPSDGPGNIVRSTPAPTDLVIATPGMPIYVPYAAALPTFIDADVLIKQMSTALGRVVTPQSSSSISVSQPPSSAISTSRAITPSSSILATTSMPISTNLSSTTPSATGNPSPDHGLSGGAIAGTVVGVLAGIAVIAAVGFLVWRRRRKLTGDTSRSVAEDPRNTTDAKNRGLESRYEPMSRSSGLLGAEVQQK